MVVMGTLGEIMHDRMAAEYGEDALAGMYDLVVPVPIHRSKKKKTSCFIRVDAI